jgi:hypothetical protein
MRAYLRYKNLDNQAPGAGTASREAYFGIFTNTGGNKGALTTGAVTQFAKTTTTAPPTPTTAIVDFIGSFSLAALSRTSAALTLPSAAGVGQVALLGVHMEATTATPTIAGWTKVDARDNGTARTSVWYRRLTGTNDNPSITWGGSSVYMSAAGAVYGDVIAAGNPIEASSGRVNASSVSMTANSVTTVSPKAALVFVGFDTTQNNVTAPTNFVERFDSFADNHTYIADRLEVATPAASGAVTATIDVAAPNEAYLIALAPAGTTVPSAPALDTLIDEFNTGTTPNTTRWPNIVGGATIANGNLVLAPTSAAPIAEIKTNAIYDPRGKSITVGPIVPSNVASGTGSKKGAYCSIGPSNSSVGWAGWSEFDGNFVCNIAGLDGVDDGPTSIAFDSVSMRYARISIGADGAALTFATSPDGVTWTTRRSGTAEWPMSAFVPAWVSLGAKIQSGTPTLTPASFGMINGTVVATQPTVTRTFWGGYKQLTGGSGVAQGPWTIAASDATAAIAPSRTIVIQINPGAPIVQPPLDLSPLTGLMAQAGDGRILVGVNEPTDARIVAVEYEVFNTSTSAWEVRKRV